MGQFSSAPRSQVTSTFLLGRVGPSFLPQILHSPSSWEKSLGEVVRQSIETANRPQDFSVFLCHFATHPVPSPEAHTICHMLARIDQCEGALTPLLMGNRVPNIPN